MSTFGNYFKFTTFGESHCHSVGVTINSPPPNFSSFKYLDKSEYVLRPDFINSLRMLVD